MSELFYGATLKRSLNLCETTSAAVFIRSTKQERKLDWPPAPGGDVIVVNGSYTDLDKLGNAYAKGGE